MRAKPRIWKSHDGWWILGADTSDDIYTPAGRYVLVYAKAWHFSGILKAFDAWRKDGWGLVATSASEPTSLRCSRAL